MNYRRLTLGDRYQIYAYLDSAKSITEIATKLGVARSTIARELARCRGAYDPEKADDIAKRRSSSRRRDKIKLRGSLRRYVRRRIKEDYSPDQIVGFLKHRGRKCVSHQSIYRYIARRKLRGDNLWQRLRILSKERRERKLNNYRLMRETRNDRVHISERPKVVDERKRLGDYERDTVFGLKNEVHLLTIVDRTSRKTWIRLIREKNAQLTHEATVDALKNEIVHTITNDNGTEFSRHKETADALGAKAYHANAYASWERGTNENTNGLIRQYCPRKRSMAHLTDADLRRIEDRLNNRPRKVLGYKTPNEVHRELKPPDER